MRVLLAAGHDPGDRVPLTRTLVAAGHHVDTTATGPDAVALASRARFDSVVLDLKPEEDSVAVVRQLRAADYMAPVLVLVGLDTPSEIVTVLDSGADDCLPKPFACSVLLARLRALSRRPPVLERFVLRCADLEIDAVAQRVTRGSTPIRLTGREYALLEGLARDCGYVVERSALVERVWNEQDIRDNTLHVTMMSLRRKIDGGQTVRLIHTVRGVGYVLRAHPRRDAARGVGSRQGASVTTT